MTGPPPLTGLKVLELAGLAPGPFAGLLLADAGASVLRVDRPGAGVTTTTTAPTPDQLTRHKASIAVDLKSPSGAALITELARHADVLIDPFRPGVMERLGLGPEVLLRGTSGGNPRLIYARLTGFRRDGRYRGMAGHDINYLAVSGVLSILGGRRSGPEGGSNKPTPPVNILGDFAGGGAVLFQGVLLALVARGRTGRGQVVEGNMVDGAGYLATSPRLLRRRRRGGSPRGVGDGPRGSNLLDGGCPFYDTYETADGRYVAVGALEPQFFAVLIGGMGLEGRGWEGRRGDRSCWGDMRGEFERVFRGRTRDEWEGVFDGTDACCTPVLEYGELGGERGRGGREGDQRPVVTLRDTPCLAVDTGARGATMADGASRGQGPGVEGDGYTAQGMVPGEKGEERLREWLGWERGKQFEVEEGGGLVLKATAKL